MANLEQIVSRKAENDTKWKEAQQAERENTTAMQDVYKRQLLERALEYLHTPEVEHTSNEWKQDKNGIWEISNRCLLYTS